MHWLAGGLVLAVLASPGAAWPKAPAVDMRVDVRIDALVTQSRVEEGQGKAAEAAALMKQAVAVAETSAPERIYVLLSRLGDLLSTYDSPGFIANTDRMVILADKQFGPEDYRTAEIHLIQHVNAGLRNDDATTLRYAPADIATMRRLAKNATDVVNTSSWSVILCKRFVANGKDAEARTLFAQAMDGLDHQPEAQALLDNPNAVLKNPDKSLTKNGELVYAAAVAFENAADLLTGWNNYPGALDFSKRAINLYTRIDGEKSGLLPVALSDFAKLLMLTGQAAAAEPYLVRALAIADQSVPPQVTNVVRILDDFGNYYAGAGRPELAEPLFSRAILMSESLPANSQLAEGIFGRLADLYLEQGDIKKSREINQRAITRMESQTKRSPAAGFSYLRRARIELAAGDFPAASAFAEKGRAVFTEILSADDPRQADVQATLARIAERQRDFSKAADLWTQAALGMVKRGYPNATHESTAIRASFANILAARPANWAAARVAGDSMAGRIARSAILPTRGTPISVGDQSLFDMLLDIGWAEQQRTF